MKFRLNKDYKLIGGDVIPSGTELIPNENGKHYLIKGDFQMGFTTEQLLESSDTFTKNEIDITHKELTQDLEELDNTVVKKWRIQLDIVTTENKRQEIQRRIEQVIGEIL
jgi:hypothetical protein